jgi:hypothetical protein
MKKFCILCSLEEKSNSAHDVALSSTNNYTGAQQPIATAREVSW